MNEVMTIREGLIDYLNILSGTVSNFLLNNNVNDQHFTNIVDLIKEIKDKSSKITTIDQSEELKKAINHLETQIEDYIFEFRKTQLPSRAIELVENGYSIEDVIRLTTVSNADLEAIADNIFNSISSDCKPDQSPVCIYLGGQPGCGKSTRSINLKKRGFQNGFVEIGIDNYRTYHPNYLEIEKTIKEHWKGKTPTPNSSQGNDIANFTHDFAGKITDLLEKKAAEHNYNILFEWGMRTPNDPLRVMKELKEKGYYNIVDFIAVHKDISWAACKLRADVMNSQNHIVRRVPFNFHKLCIDTLPSSCETIYQEGYINNKYIDKFFISTRNNFIIWDQNSKESPKKTYEEYLHDPKLSLHVTNNKNQAIISYEIESRGLHEKEIDSMLEIEQEKTTNTNIK